MTPGLIQSVIDAKPQPLTRAVVQMHLIADEPQREIAELRKALAESESAYDQLADRYADLERHCGQLRQTITAYEHRLQLYSHVLVYSTPGVIRGRR